MIFVLVVDDEIEAPGRDGESRGYMAYYLRELEGHGFAVFSARGAQEAVIEAKRIKEQLHPRDHFVVVIDIMMHETADFPNPQGMKTGQLLAESFSKQFGASDRFHILLLSNLFVNRTAGNDAQSLVDKRVVKKVLCKTDTLPEDLVFVIQEIVRKQ